MAKGMRGNKKRKVKASQLLHPAFLKVHLIGATLKFRLCHPNLRLWEHGVLQAPLLYGRLLG
jgi:hypothetical protein